ncbi:MAG: phosphoribosyltransferase family protein [Patescibacteria group bacterium]
MHIPAKRLIQTVDYSKKIFRWFFDLIFPPRCLGCRQYLNERPIEYLCKACGHTIKIKRSFECIECKAPSILGLPCPLCRRTAAIDQLLIAADFNDPLVERLIKTYKYKFIPEIALPLGRILTQYITFLNINKSYGIFRDNPLIMPVPLHPYRLHWRGFNQSGILAKQLANSYQMEWTDEVLMRKRRTPPQATAENREIRLANINGLFTCRQYHRIEGRPILLIDDVCTSGATLNGCAEILKRHGASSVCALVVARG